MLPTGGLVIEAPEIYRGGYGQVDIFGAAQVSPAAGADIALTVPNATLRALLYLKATFTASAAAANRLIGFQVKAQDGTVVFNYNSTVAVTAGLNATYTFSKDVGTVPSTAFATGNHLFMPLPDTVMPGGWTFGTTTLNIDVADAWTSVAIWCQDFLPLEDPANYVKANGVHE